MEQLLKVWNDIYNFIKEKWLYFAIGSGVVIIALIVILGYIAVQKSEEEKLKTKFDLAYFSYINSSRNNQNLEESFQNFLNTLQEISSTGKNYNVVAVANIILGDIYYNNEGRSYDTALSYYSKATNSTSDFLRVVAIFNVAQTYEAIGNFDKSLENYKLVYTLYPKSFLAPVALVKSAEIYYYLGDRNKALEMYSLVTNKYPDSSVNNIANLFELILQQVK